MIGLILTPGDRALKVISKKQALAAGALGKGAPGREGIRWTKK